MTGVSTPEEQPVNWTVRGQPPYGPQAAAAPPPPWPNAPYSAPGQPYYPPRAYQAPPPVKRKIDREVLWVSIGAGVIILASLIVYLMYKPISLGGSSEISPRVTVVSCTSDGTMVSLKFQVTNEDTSAHDYYATGTVDHQPLMPAILRNVAPGETANGELVGGASTPGRCDLTKVEQQ